MRTKHIFTAMVLPALFAACSAEDLVDKSEGNLDFANRAKLGEVTMTLPNSADTRFGWSEDTNGWDFEDTDAFSAFLVNGAGAASSVATDILATNYIFKKVDSAFKTTSVMVEGKYWFYAPAAAEKNDRKPISFELPAVQDAASYKGEAAKVFFTPVYSIMQKDDLASIPLTMRSWYSTVLVPVKNSTTNERGEGQDIVVKQIILTAATGDEFLVKGEISPVEVAKAYSYAYDSEKGEWTLTDEKANEAALVTANNKTTSPSLILNLVAGESAGQKIAAGESYTFKMIAPRTGKAITSVTIVTDKGTKIINDAKELSTTAIAHNTTKAIFGVADKKAKVYSLEETADDAGTYIMSQEDMITFALAAKDLEGAAVINNVGSWEFNAVILNALNKTAENITFNNPVTIAANAVLNPTAAKLLTFKGVTVKSGTLNISAGQAKVLTGAITVNEGAKLNLSVASTETRIITNNGTIELAAAQSATSITNKATGTVNVSSTALAITMAGGTLNYIADVNMGTVTVDANAADVAKAITVATGKTLTVDADVDTDAKTTITNNGTISISSSKTLTNVGSLTNAGSIAGAGSLTNSGTITNNQYKSIAVATIANNAEAVIGNAGTLGAVTNSGLINMTSTYAVVGDVTATGRIDNTIGSISLGTVTTQTVFSIISKDIENGDDKALTFDSERKINTIAIAAGKNWTIAEVATLSLGVEFLGNNLVNFTTSTARLALTSGSIAINGAGVKFNGLNLAKNTIAVDDVTFGNADKTKANLALAGVDLQVGEVAAAGNINSYLFDKNIPSKLSLESTAAAKAIAMSQASYKALKETAGAVFVQDYIELTIGDITNLNVINATTNVATTIGLTHVLSTGLINDGSAIKTVVKIDNTAAAVMKWAFDTDATKWAVVI